MNGERDSDGRDGATGTGLLGPLRALPRLLGGSAATTPLSGSLSSATAGRYLETTDGGDTLDFTGPAEWENEGIYDNAATGSASVVAGGTCNEARANAAAVAGGFGNVAEEMAGTVAGGLANQAHAEYATVAGGFRNLADADHATVAGGSNSHAFGEFSAIAGGAGNETHDPNAAVSGGEDNVATGESSLAASDRYNLRIHHPEPVRTGASLLDRPLPGSRARGHSIPRAGEPH